jgi:hypothetical protein
MANEVFINIKDLPELTEINNGDYIVVETSTGTHILDFINLIIPPANSVLTNIVSDNTTAVINISSIVVDNSSRIDELSAHVNDGFTTSIGSLCGQVEDLSTKIETISAS